MNKNKNLRAFVIMCFDKRLTIVYEKVIRIILKSYDIDCIRADEIRKVGNIVKQIEEEIQKCDLIVCDLTYSNPNVFFELGIAHCLNKNIIHITQEPSNIPFDVNNIRMIPYEDTKEGLLDLRDTFSEFVKDLFPISQSKKKGIPRIDYIPPPNNLNKLRFDLLSETSHIKHYAIKFLGDSKDKESFDTIERISGIDTNPDILRDAFWALYKIDPDKAKQKLIDNGLKWQKEFLVRERVVSILGNYDPDEELTQLFLNQIEDTSWGVRKAVCEVFEKWGIDNKDINDKLLNCLRDEEQYVRFAAKRTLEKISKKQQEKEVLI